MIASTTIAAAMNGAAFAHDGDQRLPGHVGDDEQQQPERRREQADHDVDDDHHAEVHEVDAQRLGRRE